MSGVDRKGRKGFTKSAKKSDFEVLGSRFEVLDLIHSRPIAGMV
jgi:hypothetical protein